MLNERLMNIHVSFANLKNSDAVDGSSSIYFFACSYADEFMYIVEWIIKIKT